MLDKENFIEQKITPGKTTILMDSFYFKRGEGIMVFRCAIRNKNLFWKEIKHENLEEYRSGLRYLKKEGWDIQAIVSDGKRGLLTILPDIPIQMCQFHQVQIVLRYITRNPRLQAGIELKEIVLRLKQTDQLSFEYWLKNWHEKWGSFLSEKGINPITEKSHFIHKRLRSAYFSIRRNLPYLFIFIQYPELKIPNTNNSLESIIGHVKTKLSVHRGLKKHRRFKVISVLLNN